MTAYWAAPIILGINSNHFRDKQYCHLYFGNLMLGDIAFLLLISSIKKIPRYGGILWYPGNQL